MVHWLVKDLKGERLEGGRQDLGEEACGWTYGRGHKVWRSLYCTLMLPSESIQHRRSNNNQKNNLTSWFNRLCHLSDGITACSRSSGRWGERLCLDPVSGASTHQGWLSHCCGWKSVLTATEANTEVLITWPSPETNQPLGNKLTTLDPFHLGTGSNSSCLEVTHILSMGLPFLPTGLSQYHCTGLIERVIHWHGCTMQHNYGTHVRAKEVQWCRTGTGSRLHCSYHTVCQSCQPGRAVVLKKGTFLAPTTKNYSA